MWPRALAMVTLTASPLTASGSPSKGRVSTSLPEITAKTAAPMEIQPGRWSRTTMETQQPTSSRHKSNCMNMTWWVDSDLREAFWAKMPTQVECHSSTCDLWVVLFFSGHRFVPYSYHREWSCGEGVSHGVCWWDGQDHLGINNCEEIHLEFPYLSSWSVIHLEQTSGCLLQTVTVKSGIQVKYSKRWWFSISVLTTMREKVCGLCGNFNGDQSDDWTIGNSPYCMTKYADAVPGEIVSPLHLFTEKP